MQGVYGYVDDSASIVVDAYLLDHAVSFGYADESGKASYAMVDVYDIVADLKLLDLLECQSHLALAGVLVA